MRVRLDKVPQSHWAHDAAATAVGAALSNFGILVLPGFWKRRIYLHFSTDGITQTGTLIGKLNFYFNGQLMATEPLANKQVNNIPQRMFTTSGTAVGPEFIGYRVTNGGAAIYINPHDFLVECDEIRVEWDTATGVAGQRGQYFLGCLSERVW